MTLDDFESFVDEAEALASGFDAPWPPHLRLDFERADAIDSALRAEVAAHGWEVAGDDAYPWALHAEGDGVVRSATSHEIAVLEAIARALPRVLDDRPVIAEASRCGEPWTRTVRVAVHTGEVDVSLRAPPAAGDERVGDRGPDVDGGDDVLGALAWLANESDGEFDADRTRGARGSPSRRVPGVVGRRDQLEPAGVPARDGLRGQPLRRRSPPPRRASSARSCSRSSLRR